MNNNWKEQLNSVTPVSKILAAVLFVALPFLGFWLGLEYGVSKALYADVSNAASGAATVMEVILQ